MKRREQKVRSINQSNFAQNIGNRNGKARRAKRYSSKKLREALRQRTIKEECACGWCQMYGNGSCEFIPDNDYD